MSPKLRSHARRGLAGALLLPLAFAATASAADPDPRLRFTAATATGEEFGSADPVALSAGGRTLLFNAAARNATVETGYVRDVATNTTTGPLPSGTTWIAASDDLSKAIVSTKQALTSDDKNNTVDGYILDRATAKYTLLTRKATGGAALGVGFQATISGDGKFAHFSYSQPLEWGYEAKGPYKYNVATGAINAIGAAGNLADQQNTDTAGNVVLGASSVWVRGAKTDVDYKGYEWQLATNAVADDGSASAWRQEGNIRVLISSTKKIVDVDLGQQVLGVLNVSSGGNYVLASFQKDQDRTEQSLEWVNVRTGTRELATAPFATTSAMWVPRVVSPDNKYVAFDTHVAAISTDPVPGGAPATPQTYARWFFTYYPGCNASYWPSVNPAIRPSMVLNGWRVGSDPRVPASATVTVKVTSTGKVATQTTFVPGQRRYLMGGFGGTTISGRVTFTDGSTGDFSEKVGRYTPPTNADYPLAPGLNDCKALNDLQ